MFSSRSAKRLLAGERYAPPEVVFQDNNKHGSGVWLAMKDRPGCPRAEYFCISNHPELYIEEVEETGPSVKEFETLRLEVQ